ncbi:MAG TPA: K(+)-transporting ATPase subunit C [Thermomicrobiales bacterium]|jgi:K+-transporting ATPase ATPase C chain|nr:K(+)-transporting ATPase subunit C [Thermomicrobiales bacterium]
MILRQLRTAFLMLVVMTVLTGLVYPGVVTGIAQVVFPSQADGSFVERDGQTVGSRLIGQSFVDADTNLTITGYFRGRPSAATIADDGTIISGGSNYGPTNTLLADRVSVDVAAIRQENGLPADASLPVDLVTASGSGVDPDISPASAELQVARVAQERGISEDQVRELVAEHTSGRILGFLGEERVNVLALNLALDRAAPIAPAA